jgi:hypothetical protein
VNRPAQSRFVLLRNENYHGKIYLYVRYRASVVKRPRVDTEINIFEILRVEIIRQNYRDQNQKLEGFCFIFANVRLPNVPENKCNNFIKALWRFCKDREKFRGNCNRSAKLKKY